ncbi:hypothetical protein ABZ816_38395 [Actinosynnema sp. NPDC047251]|uniref:Zinc-finger domain-containing protein n=1 Tax=Saccharothrix espanaensis (strain ATCC 51144 / DSM 44229 / JCM 9112 / NBRC 15066 / NRRL 15764) TaxID=1179773 RepID=K0JPW0_SACES|nr:hypothetical protein [Saccharothrix espanaensis]CCH29220.1 hypothetical protein BN6_19000 [Saccharothrix espanaensis DSM 44229]
MSPLPCGRSADELVAYLADRDDDPALARHVDGCADCAAELAELERRWAAVRETAVTPVPTPPGLVTRVLAAVHGVRPRLGSTPVEFDQDGGRVRVSERAVLAVCRQLAVELAAELGLHVRGTDVEDGQLQVLVAARYPAPAIAAADDLRSRLAHDLVAHLGDAAPVVHVHLIDIAP